MSIPKKPLITLLASLLGALLSSNAVSSEAFQDPVTMPNLSSTPGIVEINLEAKVAPVNVNGVTANLLTYNGTYPAPTIKVKIGDLLRVHFTNSLPVTGTNANGHNQDQTNLHTHGLHVSPEGKSDNIMLGFKSGDKFDYEYDLALQPAGSFNFYHPHSHGTVAEQMWGGLAGALEVADDTNALAEYETHLMVLKDISLQGSQPASFSMDDNMAGKEGNIVMVNGKVNPVLAMRPGQVQRWKIVNASNARFYKLNLSGNPLYVIGTDGGLLDKPYPQNSVLLAPGERIDVLVQAPTSNGDYKLLSEPYQRDAMAHGSMGGGTGMGGGAMGGGSASSSEPITLLTVNVTGSALNNSIPATLNANAVRLSIPAGTPTRQITLSMGTMGMTPAINDIAFSPTQAYTAYSNLNSYEIWEVVNKDKMDHPFHQHVNAAQVLAITGGDAAYSAFYTTAPAWKDTVIVPKEGSVRLLVPIKDFAGLAVFHCHILEHEDGGMMGIWDIRNDTGGGITRYNSNTGKLDLEDVAFNGNHFRVKLLDKGGLQFTVLDYLSLPMPVENPPTLYDASTGLVTIPKVVAGGKAYQATLQGKANGVFGVQQASPL